MDNNQDFHENNPDLYEEILASEFLDPYEGLLKHSKNTKNPIDIKKKNSPHLSRSTHLLKQRRKEPSA